MVRAYAGDIAAGPGGSFLLSAQKAGRGLLWHPDAPTDLLRLARIARSLRAGQLVQSSRRNRPADGGGLWHCALASQRRTHAGLASCHGTRQPCSADPVSDKPMSTAMNLTQQLLLALKARGATEVFGIPGDFALPLFGAIEKAAILPLHTLSHEPGLGFAADAAARVRGGLGVAAVTYGAGALNMINPRRQRLRRAGAAGGDIGGAGRP